MYYEPVFLHDRGPPLFTEMPSRNYISIDGFDYGAAAAGLFNNSNSLTPLHLDTAARRTRSDVSYVARITANLIQELKHH
jgi:hypothetical protein